MNMLLVRLAFAGALVIVGSGASAARFDLPARPEAAKPSVAIAGKSRVIQVVDVDYQLSDQERTLLAFVRLKAEAERNSR
jgi:hypothetical protein